MLYEFKTTGSACEAAICVNKSRTRVEKDGTVYLSDGQDFELELYNPMQARVLVKISVDGMPMSASGVVLNPGQRVYLDRWIDEQRKLTFSTYEVSESDLESAAARNGEVTVCFHVEEAPQDTLGLNLNKLWDDYPKKIHVYEYPYRDKFFYGSDFNSTYGTSTGVPSWNSHPLTYSSSSVDANSSTTLLCAHAPAMRETGRTERGDKSEQEFGTTFGRFSPLASQVLGFKLLPLSEKPVQASSLRRRCQCGSLLKQRYRFCPSCGHKA